MLRLGIVLGFVHGWYELLMSWLGHDRGPSLFVLHAAPRGALCWARPGVDARLCWWAVPLLDALCCLVDQGTIALFLAGEPCRVLVACGSAGVCAWLVWDVAVRVGARQGLEPVLPCVAWCTAWCNVLGTSRPMCLPVLVGSGLAGGLIVMSCTPGWSGVLAPAV